MATNLTTPTTTIEDYLPAPSNVPIANIIASRQKLIAYLTGWWPDLDTRPGSVSGDLMVTPLAVLIAASDIAIGNIMGDLDLANVAAGNVSNSQFVQAYLATFGAVANTAVVSTGVVCLTFNANQTYAFSSASQLQFGGLTFSFNINEGDPVIIYPAGTQGQPRVLTRINQGQYAVYFPVFGVNGSSVTDGTAGTSSIIIPQLISITAAGDFDPGQPADNVVTLAQKAGTTFYSATLTTRSGANAFLARQFPNLLGSSVVVTGDAEMLRDAQNPLGIYTGEVDVFVKSQAAYATGQQVVTLTYNNSQQGWNGLLNLPVIPSFFDLGGSVFSVGNFGNKQSINTLYSTSNDADYNNVGISFSSKENLGLLVAATMPPQNVQNQSITLQTNGPGTTGALIVDGVYDGYIFDAQATRAMSITFVSASTTVVNGVTYATALAQATDQVLQKSIAMTFIGNATSGATAGVAQQDYNYSTFFNGLSISIAVNGTFIPANLIGQKYNFSFSGRTGDFVVSYQYDPSLVSVEGAITNTDNTPVGVDLLTRSFLPCHITTFIVNYRAPFGATVNTVAAQQAIFNYVNSITYPDVYEDSTISQIMLSYGATGVLGVTKVGTAYPSLGSYFVSAADGTQVAVPRLLTTDLNIQANTWGVGARNINYILPSNNITFNAINY